MTLRRLIPALVAMAFLLGTPLLLAGPAQAACDEGYPPTVCRATSISGGVQLARTGSTDLAPLLGVGGVLVLAGAGALIYTRKHRVAGGSGVGPSGQAGT